MKKLLLLLLLFPTLSFSQYDFVPSDTASWTGRWVTSCGPNCSMQGWVQIYTDTINGDTTIGSYDYKRLLSKTGPNDVYFAAYRSDTATKEIFLIDKDSTNEILFFDFDAGYAVGDTVWIPNYMFNPYDGELGLGKYTLYSSSVFSLGSNNYNSYSFQFTGAQVGIFSVGDVIEISERILSENSFPFFGSMYFETTNELKCYQEPGLSFGVYCPYPQNIGSSIDENSIEVSVYPNPTASTVNFQSTEASVFDLKIYDQAGRILFDQKFEKYTEIDVSAWSNGIYTYELRSEQNVSTGKFIKE